MRTDARGHHHLRSLAAIVLVATVVLATAHAGGPAAAAEAPAWLTRKLADALGPQARLIAFAGLSVAIVYVILMVLRWTVLVPRTLRSRVTYAVLPPPDFDPRPESIEAFGQQVLGARRCVLAWLDRPACAVRIRLTTTADGQLLYAVELPARFRGSLLNAYATAYPAVDVRPVEEVG